MEKEMRKRFPESEIFEWDKESESLIPYGYQRNKDTGKQ